MQNIIKQLIIGFSIQVIFHTNNTIRNGIHQPYFNNISPFFISHCILGK
jgi:hypothetical protein